MFNSFMHKYETTASKYVNNNEKLFCCTIDEIEKTAKLLHCNRASDKKG